jgi:hypothetical protein
MWVRWCCHCKWNTRRHKQELISRTNSSFCFSVLPIQRIMRLQTACLIGVLYWLKEWNRDDVWKMLFERRCRRRNKKKSNFTSSVMIISSVDLVTGVLCLNTTEAPQYSNDAVRWTVEVSWFVSRQGHEALYNPKRPDRLWGPVSCCSESNRDTFIGVQRPVREADHQTPSSAQVKHKWRFFHSSVYLHDLHWENLLYTDATERSPTDKLKY